MLATATWRRPLPRPHRPDVIVIRRSDCQLPLARLRVSYSARDDLMPRRRRAGPHPGAPTAAPAADEENVCGGTKHFRQSFDQVAKRDLGYIAWAICCSRLGGAQGWVNRLAEWGKARGFTESGGRPESRKWRPQRFPSQLTPQEVPGATTAAPAAAPPGRAFHPFAAFSGLAATLPAMLGVGVRLEAPAQPLTRPTPEATREVLGELCRLRRGQGGSHASVWVPDEADAFVWRARVLPAEGSPLAEDLARLGSVTEDGGGGGGGGGGGQAEQDEQGGDQGTVRGM